jgi:hypothetical protein
MRPAGSCRRRVPPDVVSSVPPAIDGGHAAVGRHHGQVAAVVEQDRRRGVEGAVQVGDVGLEAVVAGAEQRDAPGGQRGDHVVLRRSVVARPADVRAAGGQGLQEDRRLGLDVEADADRHAPERAALGEVVPHGGQQPHPCADPREPLLAPRGELGGVRAGSGHVARGILPHRGGHRSLRRNDAAASPQIIATHSAAQAR